ncbi:MAG TPA: MotA/TolQ/ExbB proton channel family protein [Gemmatimonadales bacterium]|nr:MotA/TolQ/ExbB proton channel family protein [Gemmatimonadales bacterium]
MTLQTGGAIPRTPLELLLYSSTDTQVILALTALLSLAGWFVIILKWWQFRQLRRQARAFFGDVGKTTKLQEAYAIAMRQPPSPYGRLFKEAMDFYAELRPGALQEAAQRRPLSSAQLESFKMVLGKEVAAERDQLSHYIPWLAIVGSVGPLLGLLGTVVGVMNAFMGIAAKGSGNIGAVAPGVAQALVTTVAGLAAAIPAVIAYNLFVGRVRLVAGELEGFAAELIGSMAREGLV